MPVNLKQNADGSMSLHDEAVGRAALKLGGPAAASAANPRWEGKGIIKIPLTAADARHRCTSLTLRPFGRSPHWDDLPLPLHVRPIA